MTLWRTEAIDIEDNTYTLDIIGQQQGDVWSYLGYDGLGSVRQVYDSLGMVGYAASYAPYGDLFEQYGSLTTSLGFTGTVDRWNFSQVVCFRRNACQHKRQEPGVVSSD